ALSFRQAHEVAAITSREVIAKNQPLGAGYSAFGQAFKSEVGRETSLCETDYKLAVSPENFVAVRNCFGGPADEPLSAALSGYREALADMRTTATENENHIIRSEIARVAAFSELEKFEGGV
ncbi:MAG: argininosuccinate lyase, partial [Rhodobacteraceae bacterium]|nr:argininosuccinate lyase [Paracoccaceae bacterium]